MYNIKFSNFRRRISWFNPQNFGSSFTCLDLITQQESYQKLSSQLKNSKSLLLLADNAGEAVMDKLLIETLKKNTIWKCIMR
ncbi:MAG: hypothetical protein DRH34_01755 [Deltaproteobacteria bacterium]|nr:MAG: hypothetical protein DRH34_01755 [Deltaproteobacteria bacterium]